MTADVEVVLYQTSPTSIGRVICRGSRRFQMTKKPRECRSCDSTRRVNRQARGPAVVLYGVYLDDSGHCLSHQKSAELNLSFTCHLSVGDVYTHIDHIIGIQGKQPH